MRIKSREGFFYFLQDLREIGGYFRGLNSLDK